MNSILIQTTFKNYLTMLKPFYLFYNNIWKPTHFVFYVGLSYDNSNIIIQDIENKLDTKFTTKNLCNISLPYANNIIIHSNDNITVVLYRTETNQPAGSWDHLRLKLFSLIYSMEYYKKFKYYLNTDCDDFYYVKNVDIYLKDYNKNKDHFHAIEFISQQTFDLKNDFDFISCNYYFRMKGIKGKKLDTLSDHSWCRKLNLIHPIQNEIHSGKFDHICNSFDNKLKNLELTNMEDFDQTCFSFSCLDQNYLINDKHFLQSCKDVNKYEYDEETIISNFNKYYKLTDDEYKNNIIIKCNFLKKYFI